MSKGCSNCRFEHTSLSEKPCSECIFTSDAPTEWVDGSVSNADRIRAMSDEEMAELILGWVQTGACNDFGVPVTGNCNGKCVECIAEWLKQPAEEDDDGQEEAR